MNTQQQLIETATRLVGKFSLHVKDNSAGGVAAALITPRGNIYSGICINVNCGIGFCAEASAIAEMLKNRETEIDMIVAVHYRRNQIIAPCGRCRELIYQINPLNIKTKIITGTTETKTLKDLLPDIWIEKS